MSDIEWVAESDWTKVKRGDMVQLTRDEQQVVGCVNEVGLGGYWFSVKYINTFYHGADWSLFVQAPPAIVLPTEPGCYLDKDGSVWTITTRFPFREDLHARHAPFTRLEPVPETAKKVLDAVDAAWMRGHHMGDGSASHRFEVVRSLRAEFEVTL